MGTVMTQVEELGGAEGFSCLPNSGYEGDTWLLCDMVDVVIHLFNTESRQFYDLDSLWGDGAAGGVEARGRAGAGVARQFTPANCPDAH